MFSRAFVVNRPAGHRTKANLMERELKHAVESEFARYRKFLGPIRYKTITPWKNLLDWLLLWYMYRNDESIKKDGEIARFIRHYSRPLSLEGGDAFVFLTHVVSLIVTFDDPEGKLVSSLYWKYAPSASPLDTISTSVDCSTALDKFIPINLRRTVQTSEQDNALLEESRQHKKKGLIERFKRFKKNLHKVQQ